MPDTDGNKPLQGLRVLVVEDDAIIAIDLEYLLSTRFRCDVIGPVMKVGEGQMLAETADIDVALLDVNLQYGDNVLPVVEALRKRKIPFAYVTGNTPKMIQDMQGPDAKVVSKPFEPDTIFNTLVQLREMKLQGG